MNRSKVKVKVTSFSELEIWPCDWGTISQFDGAGLFTFVLVFVSRNFELGTNVTCEESTVSPVRG